MAVRSRKGRIEARRRHLARLRRPDLNRFYGINLADITPGAWTFRLSLVPGRGKKGVVIDHVVESFDWADEAAALTGNLSIVRPDPRKPSALPIAVGDRVKCDVRWRGSWYQLWQMGVEPWQTTLPDNAVSIPLADDLVQLDRGKIDWSYRKTKHRKRGWKADEVTRNVAKRLGLEVGQLARCRIRFDRLVKKKTSGLDILRQAWQKERDGTGRRFVIRIRNGKLEVIALRRNLILYVFKDQIQEAVLAMEQSSHPATVLVGRGHIGKGKGAKKVRHTEVRRDVLRRFGRVTREKDYGQVHSLADLKARVKRDYAKQLKITRTAQLTVPCVPFIRRGDGIQWRTNEPGWHGATSTTRDRSFVFCRTVRHSVSQDGQTTSLDLVQNDPYVKDALRLDKEQREKARKKRAARKRGGH